MDGYFGNPIKVGFPCLMCGEAHSLPGETIACFEEYARGRIKRDPVHRERVRGLRGKILGCFCKPRPCHGDVLASLAEELAEENAGKPI